MISRMNVIQIISKRIQNLLLQGGVIICRQAIEVDKIADGLIKTVSKFLNTEMAI